MKIRAACFESIGKVRLVERELTLGPDEVMVKTHQASICQADVKILTKGCYVDGVPSKFPFFPGHEAGGEVVEVGPHVHEFKPGDKVMMMHDTRAAKGGPRRNRRLFQNEADRSDQSPRGIGYGSRLPCRNDLPVCFCGLSFRGETRGYRGCDRTQLHRANYRPGSQKERGRHPYCCR